MYFSSKVEIDYLATSYQAIHVAAIKVQDLSSRLGSFSPDDVDASLRTEVEAASKYLNYSVYDDADKIQLYQWMLEVKHMKLRSRLAR